MDGVNEGCEWMQRRLRGDAASGGIYTMMSLPIVYGLWHIREGPGGDLYCANGVQ